MHNASHLRQFWRCGAPEKLSSHVVARQDALVKGSAEITIGIALVAAQTKQCKALPLLLLSDITAHDERMV